MTIQLARKKIPGGKFSQEKGPFSLKEKVGNGIAEGKAYPLRKIQKGKEKN